MNRTGRGTTGARIGIDERSMMESRGSHLGGPGAGGPPEDRARTGEIAGPPRPVDLDGRSVPETSAHPDPRPGVDWR
jgi:hypothetical protein